MAANLYMIFGADAEVIRERVADLVGPEVAGRLEIAISSDHNHHGPDTAFDVNHEWYDLMIDQSAAAIVEAIDELRPARLDVAETDHYFGLRDSRDPQVIDPTLGVLRATATNGKTIATMVFWGNHPETTLGWNPPAGNIADECAQINLSPCTIKDRVFTADFPGWATRIIEDELGGEAAYFNGAVGDLITPLGANVWEVSDDAPLGLGLVPPAGAQPAIGASNFQEQELPPHLSDRTGARHRRARCAGARDADHHTDRRLRRHARSTHACRTSASASWPSPATTASPAWDTRRGCCTRARRPVRRTTPRAHRTKWRRRPIRSSARSASVTTRGHRSPTCASARWA